VQSGRVRDDPHTHAIIGAAMEVHRVMGPGFLEAVYADALELEFQDRGVPYLREAPLILHYKGRPIRSTYRCDFLCYARVVVELKAIRALTANDDAQLLHYLKGTQMLVGLLLNFAEPSLARRRFVL
jgi:GxxExxY protein